MGRSNPRNREWKLWQDGLLCCAVVFAIYLSGAILAGNLQGKSWQSHIIPAAVFGLMLTASNLFLMAKARRGDWLPSKPLASFLEFVRRNQPAFARLAVVLSFLAACLMWILCREPVYHSPISHIEFHGKAAGITPAIWTLQALSLAFLLLAWNGKRTFSCWMVCIALFLISWFVIQPTFYT